MEIDDVPSLVTALIVVTMGLDHRYFGDVSVQPFVQRLQVQLGPSSTFCELNTNKRSMKVAIERLCPQQHEEL